MRAIALLTLMTIAAWVRAGETTIVDTRPFPSIFGDNVMLFGPDMDMDSIQHSLDAL